MGRCGDNGNNGWTGGGNVSYDSNFQDRILLRIYPPSFVSPSPFLPSTLNIK